MSVFWVSLLARFLEPDPKRPTNLQELQCRLNRDNTSVETLREIVSQLIHVVTNQQTTIEEQRRKINELSDVSIHSLITKNDLSRRLLELQLVRYSQKQHLIFDSIEVGTDQGLTTALNLLNNHLRIKTNRQDIMACDPLGPGEVAPVIVNFGYYHYRETTWARKGHLLGLRNSLRRYIYLRSVLLSTIETVMEAKNLNILTITKKNKDENVPPYKIIHLNDFQSLATKLFAILRKKRWRNR